MKKVIFILGLSIILCSLAYSAPLELTTNWRIDAGNPSYPWFTAGTDNVRGLAYNPVTDHVLVVHRASGTDYGIHALNAANGQETTSISTTGIQAIGNHYIRRIGVADDGKIYVCSLSIAGAPFAIYRYTNEADTATLIYSGTTTLRRGDVFRVVGSGDSTRLFVSGGLSVTGPPGFVDVFDGNGTNLSTITLNTAAGASAVTGIAAESTTGNLWVTKSDQSGFYSWKKVDSTGTILDSINTTHCSQRIK